MIKGGRSEIGTGIPETMATVKLDLIGLKCPLPVIRTQRALKRLAAGDRLEVHCSDQLAVIDIPNLIRQTGDRVEMTERSAVRIVFLIEKVAATSA
jgi:tRNA 2-thiouridine synthesizing protein A